MSMNLAKQTFTYEPSHYFAGTDIRVTTSVKKAAAEIKAHAPVYLDTDGKAAVVAAADVSKVYGLAEEAAAAGEDVIVDLTGEYYADALELESGVTVDALEVPLRNIGIFLK
jgi:hypothetical protein